VERLFVERLPDSTNAFTFCYPANLNLETQVETWVVLENYPTLVYTSLGQLFFLNNHQVGFFLKLFWGPHVLLILISMFLVAR
jgi:hypothetical protein